LAITSNPRYESARLGEAQVAAWLQSQGFQVIATNFRRKALELDLIASKRRELLFIEVKVRKGIVEDWQQLVPPRKLAALWRGVSHFLSEHPEYGDYTVHLGLALVQKGITWMRLPMETGI
jgi:putative endonuclease